MHVSTSIYRNTRSISGCTQISGTRVRQTWGKWYRHRYIDTDIPLRVGAVVMINVGLAQACLNYKNKIITRGTITWSWAHKDVNHRTELLKAFAIADAVTEDDNRSLPCYSLLCAQPVQSRDNQLPMAWLHIHQVHDSFCCLHKCFSLLCLRSLHLSLHFQNFHFQVIFIVFV